MLPIIRESILGYLWKHLYFQQAGLKTVDGLPIHIINQGHKNTDAGPDFSFAKIKIGNIEWVGNVEIHVKTSDWFLHGHQHQESYKNVILHVVYENDTKHTSGVPILELKPYISHELAQKCLLLIQDENPVPCGRIVHNVDPIIVLSMLDRAFTQRLQRKANNILARLKANHHDWEETTYQVIAQHFGFKINSEAFLRLAERLPLKILLKHADNVMQLEAMLFGQAGLLDDDVNDAYYLALKKEYLFLSHKYNLDKNKMLAHEWKLLRLRPANFPAIRLSQLAALIHQSNGLLFSTIIETKSPQELQKLFYVQQSVYWQTHYTFGKASSVPIPAMGKQGVQLLLINTISVIFSAYSLYKDQPDYIEQAISYLEKLPPEKNRITQLWSERGITIENAFYSQASIELYNNFCAQKACLNCNIGHKIIHSD